MPVVACEPATATQGDAAKMTATAEEVANAARGRGHAGRRNAFVGLALANTLWAGTYTAGKIALRELSPVELNALRFLLATLILAPALVRGRRRIPRDR